MDINKFSASELQAYIAKVTEADAANDRDAQINAHQVSFQTVFADPGKPNAFQLYLARCHAFVERGIPLTKDLFDDMPTPKLFWNAFASASCEKAMQAPGVSELLVGYLLSEDFDLNKRYSLMTSRGWYARDISPLTHAVLEKLPNLTLALLKAGADLESVPAPESHKGASFESRFFDFVAQHWDSDPQSVARLAEFMMQRRIDSLLDHAPVAQNAHDGVARRSPARAL